MDHRTPRTSELLTAVLAAQEGEKVAIGDLVNALRNRAFGILFLLFGIPNCIPMPPGIPVICGIILALIGLQMALGRHDLWLPDIIAKRTFSRAMLERIVNRSGPYIRRFESWSTPRYPHVSGPIGRHIMGVTVVVLGLVLAFLPIPFFGNIPPGIAVCILGLGLVERDGLIIIIGYVASVFALITLGLMAWALWKGALAIF